MWRWRTTPHCLTLLRAPAGSEAGHGARPPACRSPEHRIPDRRALRQQLAAHAAARSRGRFAPRRPAGAARATGRAGGDSEDRFAGYAGTLRILDESRAGSTDTAHGGRARSRSATRLARPARADPRGSRASRASSGGLRRQPGPSISNDHLDRARRRRAMNAMIDALLALSKLSYQWRSRQPVNLSQLAAFVAEDLRRRRRAARSRCTSGPACR